MRPRWEKLLLPDGPRRAQGARAEYFQTEEVGEGGASSCVWLSGPFTGDRGKQNRETPVLLLFPFKAKLLDHRRCRGNQHTADVLAGAGPAGSGPGGGVGPAHLRRLGLGCPASQQSPWSQGVSHEA